MGFGKSEGIKIRGNGAVLCAPFMSDKIKTLALRAPLSVCLCVSVCVSVCACLSVSVISCVCLCYAARAKSSGQSNVCVCVGLPEDLKRVRPTWRILRISKNFEEIRDAHRPSSVSQPQAT